MAGAFGSFFFADACKQSPLWTTSPWLSIVLLVVLAMAVSVSVAVLLERIAYRPLRGTPRLVPLITAIGASLFLQNTFRGLFGAQTRGLPEALGPERDPDDPRVPIRKVQVLVLVVAVVLMVALTLFVSTDEDRQVHARRGRGCRHREPHGHQRRPGHRFDVHHRRHARGIAGVLFALTFGNISYFMGFAPGHHRVHGRRPRRIGISGAAIGGLAIGILQSVGPASCSSGSTCRPVPAEDVVTFLILILVLLFRPGGILGTGEAEKRLTWRCPLPSRREGRRIGGLVLVYRAMVGMIAYSTSCP